MAHNTLEPRRWRRSMPTTQQTTTPPTTSSSSKPRQQREDDGRCRCLPGHTNDDRSALTQNNIFVLK
jgi:hypothetical protein